MNIEEIKKFIPHRYPFLLIDRVLELTSDSITTLKNVSVNEDFFNGHFPGAPIMPGVLQVEAMAQSGAVMIMKNEIDNPEESLMVFTGIRNAKFRKSVVPGDQLIINVRLDSRKRNFITMSGEATVDDVVVCQLEASAAIVPREQA
ncbi:MAG: 3-hydroxyacyl-ACP dehydratase FabZ [Balneolaceae bacterium]